MGDRHCTYQSRGTLWLTAAGVLLVLQGLVAAAPTAGRPLSDSDSDSNGDSDSSSDSDSDSAADRQLPPFDEVAFRQFLEVVRTGDPRLEDIEISNVEPELDPDSGVRPWVLLEELADDVGAAAARSRRGRGSLRVAAEHLLEAANRLRQERMDRQGALDSIADAVARIARVIARGRLDPSTGQSLLDRAGTIARLQATEVMRLVETAGADTETLAELRALLSVADALLGSGDVPAGVEALGDIALAEDSLFFDLDRFEQNIQAALVGRTVGHSYSIARDGLFERSSAFGWARTGDNPPSAAQSPQKRLNIASTTKTITATAVLQLLAANGLSINDSIEPYLPPFWTRGPGIDELTFKDLMSQKSGLQGASVSYQGLRDLVQAGINQAEKGTHKYQNSNFAIFRVALTYLWGIDPNVFGVSLPPVFDALYMFYVNQYVLEPSGVFDATCDETDPEPTRAYDFTSPGTPGVGFGNWTTLCGAGGWYLSAQEYNAFQANLRYGSLLPASMLSTMRANFLGYMNPDAFAWTYGDRGIYFNHGGDLNQPAGVQVLDTCHVDFPNGVQVVLFINTGGGGYPYQCRVLTNAYDGAWVFGLAGP